MITFSIATQGDDVKMKEHLCRNQLWKEVYY